MSKWKRQVGALNSMGKSQAKLNAIALVRQRKAEAIARLVDKIRGRSDEE